jgi:hypothetical protein
MYRLTDVAALGLCLMTLIQTHWSRVTTVLLQILRSSSGSMVSQWKPQHSRRFGQIFA